MALPLSYHWRNLFVRKTTTLLTVLVIAAVVGVFTWMVGFAAALSDSLSTAKAADKIIVLKCGATSETNSAIPVDDYNKLNQITELARDAETGEALISPEMMVQISLSRKRDQGKTWSNIAVRGVTPMAFKVHENVQLLQRMFETGGREVIAGVAATKQFEGLNVGDRINLGYGSDRAYTVVDHFTADGGPMESEIWGYLPSLMNAYSRTMYSSASVRIKPDADPAQVIKQIDEPPIQLQAKTESEYWQEQSSAMRVYMVISYVLVTVMSLAAVFSIANTMFATVAGRTQEIAMLRTIGYSRGQILSGFLMESLLLSLIGGVIGCLSCVAWLTFIGNTKDMFGAFTFTTLAFEIHLTANTVAFALLVVLVVGVFGAMVPAVRASRLQIVAALRQA